MDSKITSSPNLAYHLTDRALTPLVSSAPAPDESHADGSNRAASALGYLTTFAIAVYDSTTRLGLGAPQRVMIETNDDATVLHSYLSTQLSQAPSCTEHDQRNGNDSTLNSSTVVSSLRTPGGPVDAVSTLDDAGRERRRMADETNGTRNTGEDGQSGMEANFEAQLVQRPARRQAPLLIGTVVARRKEDLSDARRAAARIERTGRNVQREWVKGKSEDEHDGGPGEG